MIKYSIPFFLILILSSPQLFAMDAPTKSTSLQVKLRSYKQRRDYLWNHVLGHYPALSKDKVRELQNEIVGLNEQINTTLAMIKARSQEKSSLTKALREDLIQLKKEIFMEEGDSCTRTTYERYIELINAHFALKDQEKEQEEQND